MGETTDRNDPNLGHGSDDQPVPQNAAYRALRKGETVHHIDGVRSNNDILNLQLRFGQHGQGIVLVCRVCGSHDIEPEALDGR